MAPASSTLNVKTCDGKPLCTAAARLPMPKGCSGNGSKDGVVNEQNINHQLLVAVVDKLWKYPRFTKTIHSVLYSEQYELTEDDTAEQDQSWTLGKVKSLRCVPRSWVASFLLGIYSKHGLNSDTINALSLVDGEALQLLFAFEMQAPLSSPLPKEMHGDSTLSARIFRMRSELAGRRLTGLLEAGGLTKAQVLWHKGGCYSLFFGTGDSQDNVVRIVHNASNTEALVPPHVVITKQFVLENNHSDAEARVELKPSSFLLVSFFDEDAKFRKDIGENKKKGPWKALLAAANTEDSAVKSAAVQAKEIAESSRTALAAAAKQKAAIRTKHARKAVVDKQIERQKKRRVNIEDV